VYSTAPGYQFYYEELYRKSFYNEIVDKNLQNDTFIKPTWDAYFFRIINIFNRNSELDALPGLKEVGDLLAFDRINMLQSTRDSVQLAVNIYNIIKPHIVEEKGESNDDKNSQENKTREHVDRQKNFINSQYRKKRVHKNVKNQINKLADDSTKIKNYKINKNSSLPIIITDKWEDYFSSHFNHCDSAVDKGFSLGKKLLKKLKVRNNIKKDIFENQKKGKLNSKKLFQATYNENLFYRVEKEDFKNVFLRFIYHLK
jgi:PAB1-binding protein PBP1